MPLPGRVRRFGAVLVRTVLFAGLFAAALPARAAPGPTAAQVAAEIAQRRSRVTEFRAIKEAAEELGFRVWLFGGTAAGFAHYVRADLAREGGDTRYRDSFFDYDFTNIYRSTQDADLVVDATPRQAEQLEDLIRRKMSFLQGSKQYWEVRLLRHSRTAGGQVKVPLLDNPDFLEQNTDSNSTGMIELTDPPAGEGAVRDLRDWESPAPFFLQDVTEGKLHYYWSPNHEKTSRFLSGDNPPLFSVIRYLVKAFQYDLQVDGKDLKKVQEIIDRFDPQRDYRNLSGWARGWLERYGPNLIRHSVNIEYAWNTLEALKLRRKLISLSDPDTEGSLGWWLSREPLRTAPLGTGRGRTAQELGITTVAHETSDFLAYESITRDTTGRPNVLISRPGYPGESASLGPGFYTRMGRTGAAGTGLTIRFQVDPQAREGTDFTFYQDYVLFWNRAALRVIPESLGLVNYFELLLDGLEIDSNDRGIWMKLRRRLETRQSLTAEEEEPIVAIVARAIKRLRGDRYSWPEDGPREVLKAWLDLPASEAHPELYWRAALQYLRMLGDQERQHDDDPDIWSTLRKRLKNASPPPPETEAKLLKLVSKTIDEAINDLGYGGERELPPLLKGWFKLPIALEHPELLQRLIESGGFDTEVMDKVLSRPGWSSHPELVRTLIDRDDDRLSLRVAKRLLVQEQWSVHQELFQALLSHPGLRDTLLKKVFNEPGWKDHPELVQGLLDSGDGSAAAAVARFILTQPTSAAHPEWVRTILEKGGEEPLPALGEALSLPHWKDHPELVMALLNRFPDSAVPPGLLPKLVDQPQWADHPELVLKLIDRGGPFLGSVPWVLVSQQWARYPELMLALIKKRGLGPLWPSETTSYLLGLSHWRNQPRLREMCGGKAPDLICLGLLMDDEEEAGALAVELEALRAPSAECR